MTTRILTSFLALVLILLSLTGCGAATSNASTAYTSVLSSSETLSTEPKVQQIVLTDDAGREITLEKPLERVVVFNKFNSEIIRALGKVDTIVGTDKNTLQDKQYWPGWTDEMMVAVTQKDIDFEKVAALKPDAVILPTNGAYEDCIKNLEPFGIKTIVVTGWQNKDFAKQIEIIGKAFGEDQKAQEYIVFCQTQVDILSEKLKNVTPARVYLENSGEYHSCLPGSGWNDMITMGGGSNIFGDVDFAKEDQSKGSVHSFEVDREQIIERNPEAVFLNVYDSAATPGVSIYVAPDQEKLNEALKAMADRPGWNTIDAVKNGDVYGVSAFAGNGCFKIVGASYIAKYLYPEEMKDVDPDAFFSEWLEKWQGVESVSGHASQLKA